jgi:hypothetical protein
MIGSRFVGSSRGVGFGRHPFADDETEEEDGIREQVFTPERSATN